MSLDEPARRLTASSTITYTNNSPDTLRYLWLQLDQNRFREDSIAEMTRTFSAKPQTVDIHKGGALKVSAILGYPGDPADGQVQSSVTYHDGATSSDPVAVNTGLKKSTRTWATSAASRIS